LRLELYSREDLFVSTARDFSLSVILPPALTPVPINTTPAMAYPPLTDS
jgi:hypothetical protein